MKKLLLNSSLLLLGILFLNHLLVMVSFITGHKFLPFTFPLSILIPTLLYFYLEKKINIKEKIWTVLLSFSVIIISLLVSAFYFDLSWDGQWYQQAAIYNITEGWNPLSEPIAEMNTSILHFPKASWYFAASVYSSLKNFESGKSLNFILLFVTLFLTYSILQDFGFSKMKSLVITFLVALNPVVWSEITTYLVDGSLILYISIYVLMIFAWFKEPNFKNTLIIIMAVTGMINLKFTGLVFFCTLALAPAIYALIFKREYLLKFIGIHASAVIIALFIFGYNPYVTNTIKRGHPFYPIMGSEEFPSIYEQTGRDDNEIFETPVNMQGKSLFIKMFYANFGRPDNAPYYKQRDAELIWPFTSKPSDWEAYYFHETRVSGFGPYFGGILILSFILFIILLFRSNNKLRCILCLGVLVIFGSLMFSKHFWWPRFGPQMWLIPLIPLAISFYLSRSKKLDYYTWVIAVIMLINGCIVLLYHMDWETRSSITLRKQLTELQEKGVTIQVAWGAFQKSMEEKLDHWHIKYEAASMRDLRQSEDAKQLTSVVEGYPNMVLYKEKEDN